MNKLGKLESGERLYHLDLYRPKTHETYAFYAGKPTYETVRTEVMSILSGDAKPVSSWSWQ